MPPPRNVHPPWDAPAPAPRRIPPPEPGTAALPTPQPLPPRASTKPGSHRQPRRRRAPLYAGPLALLLVGGVVAVTIASGGGAAAAHKARAERLAAEIDQPDVAAGPDLSVMHDLVVSVVAASNREHSAASRSRRRVALLHRWVRPVPGVLTSPFGMRWGRLHAGIDLAGPYGAPIRAATTGCITYAGPESGYGEVMKIEDWDGSETVYGHMEAFTVTHGCVKVGQVIAKIGAMGDATGPHLHFEVRIAGVPINPIPFLERHGVRI